MSHKIALCLLDERERPTADSLWIPSWSESSCPSRKDWLTGKRISETNGMPQVSGRHWRRFPPVAASHNTFYVDSQRELPRSAAFFPGGRRKQARPAGVMEQKGTHVSSASVGLDYSKAKGSCWKTAAATGGGREGIPRWSRILRVISGARMVARMRSLPPQ